MDFDYTEEQKILKKVAHDFLAREYPLEVVRKLEAGEEGYLPEQWQKMAELGWPGLILPEEYGGSGASFLDLTILLEEMGYRISPGPFFSSVVLGAIPILMAGNEKQKKSVLPGLAEGELLFTLALYEPAGGGEASSINGSARLDQDVYILNGSKLFVPFGHVADVLLWVGRTKESTRPEEGISIFLVDAESPGISCLPLKTLTGERQCELIFQNVKVPRENVLGSVGRGWPVVRALRERAAVARSAEMVGGAQAVMDMTLDYAKGRTQFGRPIGGFQVIQHYFADMWIDIAGSRNLVYKAAWKISRDLPAAREAAMAKAWAGEAYRRVTTRGHQIFGGIGFTTEHSMHQYHRRSICGDLSFGAADDQRERLAQDLGL